METINEFTERQYEIIKHCEKILNKDILPKCIKDKNTIRNIKKIKEKCKEITETTKYSNSYVLIRRTENESKEVFSFLENKKSKCLCLKNTINMIGKLHSLCASFCYRAIETKKK